MAAKRRQQRRPFGSVRKLPSGRYQARYSGPDGRTWTARDSGGRALTFTGKGGADAYLAAVRTDIQRGQWVSPDAPRPAQPDTLAAYAAAWLASRDLAPRTAEHYGQLLRDHVLPVLGACLVTAITPAAVRQWHAGLATGPTARAHAYGLLRSIMATAVADDVIAASPCRVRGAGSAGRASRTRLPTLAELETILSRTPERFRLMVALAAWCGLRFGELAALTRADVDVSAGVVHVRRGVAYTAAGGRQPRDPKSEAGRRTVAIPPHLRPAVSDHLAHVPARRDALLFAAAHGGYLAPASLYRWWYPARDAAGRPDLRFHDLRHFAGTMYATTGATLKETMARLGHSTPGAAMRYQDVAADRDKVLAAALSGLAAPVVPIAAAKGRKTPARKSG